MSRTATATRDDERSMHDLLDSLRPGHTVSAEFRTAYGTHTLTGPVLPGLYQDNRKRTLIGELTENLRDAHGNLSADLYSITITEA